MLVRSLALTASLLVAATVGCERPANLAGADTVSVLALNLYVGSDIASVLEARTPEEIPRLAAREYAAVLAADFEGRARALARRIARDPPHLIGLQEVSLLRRQSPGDAAAGGGRAAEEVVLDFLVVLVDELRAAGADYRAVATATGFDVELPVATASGVDDVRLTDREVVLARADVIVTGRHAGGFARNRVVSIGGAGGPGLLVRRGWASVDARTAGRRVRFVTTHLDPDDLSVRDAQARELVAWLDGADLPVILVGDFASAPGGSTRAPYGEIVAAGFVDAWRAAGLPGGATCCRPPDLRSAGSGMDRRVDLVFIRAPAGGSTVVAAGLIGTDPADRTHAGLWPSDHAGVLATLRLSGRRLP